MGIWGHTKLVSLNEDMIRAAEHNDAARMKEDIQAMKARLPELKSKEFKELALLRALRSEIDSFLRSIDNLSNDMELVLERLESKGIEEAKDTIRAIDTDWARSYSSLKKAAALGKRLYEQEKRLLDNEYL